MGFRRIVTFSLKVVAFILLIWIFTPAAIIPPIKPIEPITVYVTVHGLHSRLILPNSKNQLIEYAYGDWEYFALNEQQLTNGLAALLLPTQGTIGRREYSNINQLHQVVKQNNDNLFSFEVAQAKVVELGKLLNDRFERTRNTQIKNAISGLTLVKYEQDYTVLHNSNHELVSWLENLGCQVKGFVMWANFSVQYMT